MSTYYKVDNGRRSGDDWKLISDDVDLEKFAKKQLESYQYLDNDNGYTVQIEFWKDKIRTYAVGFFDNVIDCDIMETVEIGIISDFFYGTYEEVIKEHKYLQVSKTSPGHDYLFVSYKTKVL